MLACRCLPVIATVEPDLLVNLLYICTVEIEKSFTQNTTEVAQQKVAVLCGSLAELSALSSDKELIHDLNKQGLFEILQKIRC